MGNRTPKERLQQQPPSTGRVIAENGALVNRAEWFGYSEPNLVSQQALYVVRYTSELSGGGAETLSIIPPLADGEDPPGGRFGLLRRYIRFEGGKWAIIPVEGGEVAGGDVIDTLCADRRCELGFEGRGGEVRLGADVTGGDELPESIIYAADLQPRPVGVIDDGTAFILLDEAKAYSLRIENRGTSTREYNFEVAFFYGALRDDP